MAIGILAAISLGAGSPAKGQEVRVACELQYRPDGIKMWGYVHSDQIEWFREEKPLHGIGMS